MGLIAFVTCDRLPQLTKDDRLAAEELAARGHEVRPVVWTDPSVAWPAFDAIVLRSCWDYHLRPAEFRAWLHALERAGAPLQNDAALARWNMDKTYLRNLRDAGVPIVPARWIEPGMQPSLSALRLETGWTDLVLKPAISATAWELYRVEASVDAWPAALSRALDAHRFLAQPFVPEIVGGEWSLVFFDGRYSHAVLKRPRDGGFLVQEEYGGRAAVADPTPALLASAERALVAVAGAALYARVDGVETADGFLLLELELLEPMLFLGLDRAAPARFADAIESRLRSRTGD